MGPRVGVESKYAFVYLVFLDSACLTGWVVFTKMAEVQEDKPKHVSTLQILLVKGSHMTEPTVKLELYNQPPA